MAKEKKPLKVNFILPGETEEEKERNQDAIVEEIVKYVLNIKYSQESV